MLDAEAVTSGAVLRGRGGTAVDSWLEAVADSHARQGLSQVQLYLDQDIRNPTPYYETQVTWDRVGADRVIHDRGIAYGPWLEGTGSRNATTRFKGYHHWRRVAQWLNDTESPRITERHMPALVELLGAA